MKLPAVPLPHASLPWLLAVALVTTLPHGLYQPAWLSGVAGLVLLGVTWRWWRGYQVSSAWLKVLLVFAGCAGILVQYRTLLGRDAGIAMLVLFMAMKLLELKSRRDAIVVVILGYFLLLTHYFHSQDIPTGLWLLASTLVVTGALLQLHGDPQEGPRTILLQAGRLLLQALPLMLLLYLLFPRVSGPLWGLPADAHAGRTGLSNSMSPGSISELALSDEIAFRARFDGPPPPRAARYWRGPVLNHYDGREWKVEDFRSTPPSLEALGAPYTYTLTLEAHKQHWLLPLDMPSRLPESAELKAEMTSNGLVRSKEPVTSRKNVAFTSHTRYRLGLDDPPGLLQANLQLPPGRNPRTLALARSWQRQNPDPAWLVQRALQHFRQEAFSYTLSPPLLGQEAMDDFLFRTRQGFCEHYASAFVILMRAAQVPARVVTGYMGGELNPVDNFLVVRQLDAHAWAEVWLDGQGWVRVDPTAAISPRTGGIRAGIGPPGAGTPGRDGAGVDGMAQGHAPSLGCPEQQLEPVGAGLYPGTAAGSAVPPGAGQSRLAHPDHGPQHFRGPGPAGPGRLDFPPPAGNGPGPGHLETGPGPAGKTGAALPPLGIPSGPGPPPGNGGPGAGRAGAAPRPSGLRRPLRSQTP